MAEHQITSLEQLRELYPPPNERAVLKVIDQLDSRCREFIALSPFMVMATASRGGECDCSPKGGPPGFVSVLDDHRLLIPDATGNRRIDSLQNMLENPRLGLLFLIPGMGETLRINGTVELTRDPELLAPLQTGGRPAVLAIVVEVEQAYLHCAKSVLRSGLWRSETWAEREVLPSAAEILSAHTGLGNADTVAAHLADSYVNQI